MKIGKKWNQIHLDVAVKVDGVNISIEQVEFFTIAEIKNFKDVLKVLNKKVMKLAFLEKPEESIPLISQED